MFIPLEVALHIRVICIYEYESFAWLRHTHYTLIHNNNSIHIIIYYPLLLYYK